MRSQPASCSSSIASGERARGRGAGTGARPTLFFAVKASGALAFVALLVAVFGRRGSTMDLVEFVLPPAALAAFTVRDEARRGRGRSAARFRSLAALLVPFLAGAAVPLLAFGAFFAARGALGSLVHDVFVGSIDPTRHAQYPSLEPRVLLPALLYAIVLVAPAMFGGPRHRIVPFAAGTALAFLLAFAGQPDVYRVAWDAARSLPLVVALGAVTLLAGSDPARDDAAASRVFLLASMSALVALVQFPFASPIYFCYAAPLAALATAAVVHADPRAPRRLHAVLLVFFVLFAAIWMNRGYVFRLGRFYAPYEADGVLAMPRGGLRVPIADARDYGALVAALAEAPPTSRLYAGPDCPEVYFLSGRRNPTRFFFDYQGELRDDPDALRRRIEDDGIGIVVIQGAPSFSRPLPESFEASLRTRFGPPERIGRFRLYRRGGESAPVAYNPLPRMTSRYADAGVDIDAKAAALARAKAAIRSTFTPGVLGDVGGFGGLFRPDFSALPGARPRRLDRRRRHQAQGRDRRWAATTPCGADLVNHCVNDILVQGARPLFFLDYIATGKLEPAVVEQRHRRASRARAARTARRCSAARPPRCPASTPTGEYDVAGTIVGVVDRAKILDGSRIAAGDVALGLPSAGLHTNGYSLARKVFFETMGKKPADRLPELGGRAIGGRAPRPHLSYLQAARAAARGGSRARHGAHHRRRLLRQHPARAARGPRRRRQGGRVAGAARLRAHRARGRRLLRGDAPRLQHGHRHGRLRRAGGPRRGSRRSGRTRGSAGSRSAT